MDASSDGTRRGQRGDADAPGAWRSDEIRGARPRAAARCPTQPPSSAIPESAMTTEPSGQGEPRSLSDGARRASLDSRSDAVAPLTTGTRFDPRTRLLLEAPIAGTLLRLSRMPGCRCSTPIPPCSTPDRAICTQSVRSMACSDWAWPSTSRRRGPGGCSGRCWRT